MIVLRFLIAGLFIIFSYAADAQSISGVVLDSKTNQPLPYVHIGVLNKNMGVISHDNGKFEIDLSNADKNDELVFSMLGYESVKKKIGDISQNYIEIKLIEKAEQLKEVIVRNKKPKPIKLGRFTPSGTTIGHSMFQEFGLGGEWGLRIFNKGKKQRKKILD
jgi:hypothetical protein